MADATNADPSQSHPQTPPKVLVLKPPPVFPIFEYELSLNFHFLKAYESSLPTSEFLAAANAFGVSAILAGSKDRITAADVLDHLPSLRCIVTTTTGLNHIDMQECRRRGIAVAFAGDIYSDDCADASVGLLIDVLRRVSAGDRFVRNCAWSSQRKFPLGDRLAGKRIGIVGLGSIGLRVAKRLEAFGCSILYNSRQKKPSVSYLYYSDVCQLAASSDVLVICCALTDQTWHMINREVLLALGKEGVIINIGRGHIINERELVRSLQKGEIAGAGLDVFENEPRVAWITLS